MKFSASGLMVAACILLPSHLTAAPAKKSTKADMAAQATKLNNCSDVTSLHKSLVGINQNGLLQSLSSSAGDILTRDMGKYESDEEYNSAKRGAATALLGTSDRIVIRIKVPESAIDYNREHKTFYVPLPADIEIDGKSTIVGHKVGQNAFGVKVPYDVTKASDFKIMLDRIEYEKFALIAGTTYKRLYPVEARADQAMKIKNGFYFIVMGELTSPYATKQDFNSSATLYSPSELHLRSVTLHIKPQCAYVFNTLDEAVNVVAYERE